MTDLRTALRAWPVRAYLLLQLVAAGVFVARRDGDMVTTVLLVWSALLALAFTAWWAGRHPRAWPWPDPVPGAWPRTAFALLGVIALILWGWGTDLGVVAVLLALSLGGWMWTAVRAGNLAGMGRRALRDPRPFVPLLLLIGLPKLLMVGPTFVAGLILALPSGIGQQLLLLVGLYAPLEAVTRRPASAAVVAALAFAAVHVPMVIGENGGDLWAAYANVIVWQSGVGLVAVLAFQRHRAAVPIGVAHAAAIG